MFLSRVFIGNTKTISRRTVRIAPETKKGTYYFLRDFFWSDGVSHTHQQPAHRANQNETSGASRGPEE